MYHSLNDVNFVQYKNDKWASAQREFNNPRICFCAAKREKIYPAKITAFTVLLFVFTFGFQIVYNFLSSLWKFQTSIDVEMWYSCMK